MDPLAPEEPKSELTQVQRDRLQQLQSEIVYDRITVSFSIDGKDSRGHKRSAFYSVNVSRRGSEAQSGQIGFAPDEERLVHATVSKRVVGTVYGDAVFRGILPPQEAREESKAILAAYDRYIAGLIKKAMP